MPEKTKITEATRGKFIGTSPLDGGVNVFLLKGQFAIAKGTKFLRHIKEAALRKAGIFTTDKKIRKKVFGKSGYIGHPKRT